MRIQDVLESAKAVFIDIAKDEMNRQGEKVNMSRLSVMTGLHKRDVMRLQEDTEKGVKKTGGLASRVIGQWQHDKRFQTKNAKPRVLSIEGEENEFKELVESVSIDLKPGTVLFELERIAAVEKTARGLKLKTRAYVPVGDVVEGFHMLAHDTDSLMSAVEENVFSAPEIPNLHVRTEYDKVDPEAVPLIREWFYNEGSEFHRKAREFVSQFDLDINPKKDNKDNKGSNIKAVIGSFSSVVEEQKEDK